MDLPVRYSQTAPAQRRLVREECVRRQNGKCMWCAGLLSEKPPEEVASKKIDWRRFPPNFLRYPVHLQHCHKTDMTEGAVHAYCNAVMFQYHGR